MRTILKYWRTFRLAVYWPDIIHVNRFQCRGSSFRRLPARWGPWFLSEYLVKKRMFKSGEQQRPMMGDYASQSIFSPPPAGMRENETRGRHCINVLLSTAKCRRSHDGRAKATRQIARQLIRTYAGVRFVFG